MKVSLYTQSGQQAGEIELPALFDTPVDPQLMQRYLVWVRSVLRDSISNSKTRGEVRGGGKKPWRQKGTGRARAGSSRIPHWRGGGVTFGPSSERNWATRMPRTERRKALFSAYASKAHGDGVYVLEEFAMETPKTKDIIALRDALKLSEKTKVLHIHPAMDEVIFKSTHNLRNTVSRTIQAVNMLDLVNSDVILLSKAALADLEKHHLGTNEEAV